MPGTNTDRRNVLKKLGATTVGIGMASGLASAAETVGGDTLQVLINPARSSDVDTANNEVYDAVDGFLTQLQNAGAIPGYDLSATDFSMASLYGDPGRTDDECNPSSLYDTYLTESDDDDYYDIRVYVTDDAMYAGAENEYAWETTAARTWVGTSGNYNVDTSDVTGRIKNASIQEPAHTMIDDSCIEDPYDTSHTGDKHHANGKIYDSYPRTNEASPMLVFYESSTAGCRSNDLTEKGGCKSTADWDKTHSQHATECTVDAIKHSMCKHWDDNCTTYWC